MFSYKFAKDLRLPIMKKRLRIPVSLNLSIFLITFEKLNLFLGLFKTMSKYNLSVGLIIQGLNFWASFM